MSSQSSGRFDHTKQAFLQNQKQQVQITGNAPRRQGADQGYFRRETPGASLRETIPLLSAFLAFDSASYSAYNLADSCPY
jgi:hypothetical protein